jgi:hypothetical protein
MEMLDFEPQMEYPLQDVIDSMLTRLLMQMSATKRTPRERRRRQNMFSGFDAGHVK